MATETKHTPGHGPDCVDSFNAKKMANARLIAAASDMLAAIPDLSHVISWLEIGCDPKQAAIELRIYKERIDAAIAKAEGQSNG